MAGEHLEVGGGEIAADDAEQVDGAGEVGSGERGVGGGAAEQVGGFGVGRLDMVDGDGAADEDGEGVRHGGRRSESVRK